MSHTIKCNGYNERGREPYDVIEKWFINTLSRTIDIFVGKSTSVELFYRPQ